MMYFILINMDSEKT